MIDRGKLQELIKANLPQAHEELVAEIANDVIRDAEAIIHSMVRQAVNQERENLYRKKSKD